jgi:hypothetical protein
MSFLSQTKDDNINFVVNSGKILSKTIDLWQPKEVFITKIDNWFGSDWLNFSGVSLPTFGEWNYPEITIPPFHPNRIIESKYYQKEKSSFQEREFERTLHPLQNSDKNLNRKIHQFSEQGLFLWWSSHSEQNGYGSLMIYITKQKEIHTFYIELQKSKDWTSGKLTDINKKELTELLK